ncbi:MAG TPA: DegQ family serine endoprotease [Candidatus Sulfopaludibacter sp.]|nr:DegQ family serine endoprotease [Candidatus Sulfopaludibacter sp.]
MTSNKVKAVGLALGLGWFVAVGLLVLVAAEQRPGEELLKPGPIDPALVAPAEQLSKAFIMVADHVKPAVVSVYSEKKITMTEPEFNFPFGDNFFQQFFDGQFPRMPQPHQYRGEREGMGSGMILDKQGRILTNYHVVRDVDDIKVRLADKEEFEAKIVGTDPKTDVAVIQIQGHVPADLPTITLGDSDALRPGDLVLAIGAPFGLLQTVTSGIISATGRSDVGIADLEDFLQTDAAINPGNSGGPLVNMRGEVIGMNSAIATSDGQFGGVGFAIPSDMIKAMLPKLIKGEKIIRGQLGVVIQEMTPDLAKQFGLSETKGVLISQVNKDSAAEKAGLKDGDVVIQYNGKDVNSVDALRNLVSSTLPGTKVRIQILRDGKTETLTATIGNQSATAAAPSQAGANLLSQLGLTVETLTPDLAKQYNVNAEKGAVITDVNESSLASLAGLQTGDVIVEADHQPVASMDDLEQALAKAKHKNQVLLRVTRAGVSLFVVLQMNH